MFTAVTQQFRSDDVASLSRRDLESRVASIRTLRGALDAYEARVLVAVEALDDGGLDSAGVLRSRGGASSKKAMRTAKTAARLEKMPTTKAALDEGRITGEHADALADAAEKTSPEAADELLADRNGDAPVEPADVFARRTREWTSKQQMAMPDDGLGKHERQRRNRTGMITTDETTGMGVFRFELDPTATKRAKQELESLATQMWRDDGGRNADSRTARTLQQRLADAFVDLVTGPKADACRSRHPKSQMNINIDISGLTLDDGTPLVALVDDGTALPQAVRERLACVSGLSITLFDGPSRPLWVGRDHRNATIAQWRALIARDRGCIGCGAAPNRCEAHHIQPWEEQGLTDIDNLVLVCSRCHHDLHDRGQVLTRSKGRWVIRPPELRLSTNTAGREPPRSVPAKHSPEPVATTEPTLGLTA